MGLPILWRYAVLNYLRMFALSVGTFVSVLLVLRFKEIARFAAATSNWSKAGVFTLYQIPFILPMAIPLSALIGSFLFIERLSRSYELTALRSARVSLATALSPMWIASCFLSLLNFAICTDLAPFCRRASKTMMYNTTSENPLLILQSQRSLNRDNLYARFETEKEGKKVSDLVLIGYIKRHERLSLLAANQLRLRGNQLLGQGVSTLSHLPSEDDAQFDSVILENQQSMSTEAPLLSGALRKNRLRKNELAGMSLQTLRQRTEEPGIPGTKAWLELFRRISLSISVFTFTLLGSAFGIEQGRMAKNRSLLVPLSLTLFILSSYFLGKGFKANLLFGALAYALPHPIAWGASFLQLKAINAGRK